MNASEKTSQKTEQKRRCGYGAVGLLLFVLAPLLLMWKVGNPAGRSWLPVVLSCLTVVGFALLVAQFWLVRGNRGLVQAWKMKKVLRWHKILGYTFSLVLLCHPLFVLVPRFTEAGATPKEAFVLLLTTLNAGTVTGEIAWVALLLLLLTSFFRKLLPMSYGSWRVLHGALALVMVGSGLWHAATLGRDFIPATIGFFVLVSVVGLGWYAAGYVKKKNVEETR